MINKEQTKYPAKIISNIDPQQLGRCQIYCDAIMHDWLPTDYPWAFQCKSGTGGSSSYGTSEIPEIGTYVWVWHEKANYKNWFYGEDLHWKASSYEKISPHLLFQTNVAPLIGSTATYPDVKFKYYKNGICTGVSSSSTAKEFFVYHPSGTFVIIKNDGTIQATLAAGKKLTIIGDINITGTIASTGNLNVTGKITATQNIESNAEVIAQNSSPSTAVHLSTHNHPTAVPGPASSPTPGT